MSKYRKNNNAFQTWIWFEIIFYSIRFIFFPNNLPTVYFKKWSNVGCVFIISVICFWITLLILIFFPSQKNKENKALMLYPWIYEFTNINSWSYHVIRETNQKTDIGAKLNVISMVYFTKFYKINFSKRFLGLKIIKNWRR